MANLWFRGFTCMCILSKAAAFILTHRDLRHTIPAGQTNLKWHGNSFGFLLLLCGVTVASAGCHPEQEVSPSNLERSLDELVASLLSTNRVPGMSLAIVKNGNVIYSKGFGTTNLTTQSSPTADTQYRLASVTKTFTAVGVLQLEQDGKLTSRPAATVLNFRC